LIVELRKKKAAELVGGFLWVIKNWPGALPAAELSLVRFFQLQGNIIAQ
jgi:hypothetical protein